MSSRANLLKCTGLETYGNELTRKQGSLKRALNINVDENGVATPRRGLAGYANFTNDAESIDPEFRVTQILEYKNRIFRHYSDKMEFENESNTFSPITGTYNQIVDGYRLKYQEASSNMYFTSSEGIKKMSIKSESDITVSKGVTVTDAGAPKGSDLFATVVPSSAGFLPPQSKCAYRVLFGTKDINNNLILGAPTARFVVTNFTNDLNLEERSSVLIDDYTLIVEGDYFIISTLSQKYTVYFIVATDTPPKKSDTIGSIYVPVTITAASTNADVASIMANEMAVFIPNISIGIDSNNADRVVVTNTEEGDIEDISAALTPSTGFTVETLNDGTVTTGSYANCDVNFTVPSGITTEYFYQVYRTSSISATDGLILNDIDPGDEMNLVFEEAITSTDISAQEVTYTDSIPESFRGSNAFLYTNEISGEGILQANEQPPVALDIELFNNSMFYANTRSKHILNFNVVSVDDFINGSTRFIVGNSDVTRYYTFSGGPQETTITAGPLATTVNGSYITFSSSSNERKYAMYLDKDNTALPPALSGRILVRADLTNAVTTDDIAEAMYDALLSIQDFELTLSTDELTIKNVNNGEAETTDTITSTPATDLGPTWAIVTDAVGYGEVYDTADGGDVLLSTLGSVAQSIDETTRSLVKVINRDTQSPVNAFYVSGAVDLPGIMYLENKSIASGEFYITLEEPSNAAIGEEVSPTLPLALPIEQIDGNTTSTTIKVTGHGYSNGQEIYISYKKLIPADPDPFQGKFEISNVTANTFDIQFPTPASVIAFVPAADNTAVF